MSQTVFIFILLVPAVFGMAEFLYLLKGCILSPVGKQKRYSVIFLKENDAVLSLRSFCEENNWYGNFKKYKFFAVYDSLSKETLKECELLTDKYGIILLNIEDFKDKIKDFL